MKTEKDLYAVILAGGSGTRFWPLSRKLKPKQFLTIESENTLLQQTIKRVMPLIKAKNIFIVTGAIYKKEILRQTKAFKIPSMNILLEPSGKNTAPAICWAASKIQRINKNAVMAVLPSDHLITNNKKFLNVLSQANKLACDDYLVTFGITPTRPETGYGYLKTKKQKKGAKSVVRVEKFTEKPSLKVAKQFVKKKNYLWNSGMFVWKTSVILEEFNCLLPKIAKVFQKGSSKEFIQRHWKKLPSISIDYGILEKSKCVAAVEAKNIGWSDLGSWESLKDIISKDKNGNYFKGNVISLDCQNTLVNGEKRVIAAIGCEDLIIVDAEDALLVCQSQHSQRVREVVDSLKKSKNSCI